MVLFAAGEKKERHDADPATSHLAELARGHAEPARVVDVEVEPARHVQRRARDVRERA